MKFVSPAVRSLGLALALTLPMLPTLASAATVSATYSPLGGNSWQAAFVFSNGAGDAAAQGLSVFFDPTLYSNLSLPMAPSGWDPLVLPPDLGLPSAGLFDALALDVADALQPGNSLDGFSVRFDYLGSSTPGALRFEFYNLDGNNEVVPTTSGTATATVVPEPGSLALSALALVAAGALRRRGVAP